MFLNTNRRDFRLVVGAADDPTKAVPHPVVWLTTNDSLIITETPTTITYRAAFVKPRKQIKKLILILNSNLKSINF
jgi:hypothetical protein